jgi:hypothetical protein
LDTAGWWTIFVLAAAAVCQGASRSQGAGVIVRGSPTTIRWVWNSPGSPAVSSNPASPAVAADRQARLQKALACAQKLFDKGQYAASCKAADQAYSLAADNSGRQQVQRIYDQLDAVGQKEMMVHCQAYLDKKYPQAIDGFNYVSATFGKLPCALQARMLLKEARGSWEVQKALQEAKAQEIEQSLGAILPQSAPADGRVAAIKKLDVANQAAAMKLLQQLADLCDDTNSGRQAAKDLQSLHDDEKFMAALDRYQANEKARTLLKLASAYTGAARPDKAAQTYQQIVEDYPQTDSADAAKEKLAANAMSY